jgi:putative MATE family efflux protein
MPEIGGSAGRGAAFDRDWTKGSIFRNLLSLSWPMMVTESAYIVTTIDMIWVGRLGTAAIAGMGIAFIVVMLVMAALLGIIVGVRAMVARFVGAGDIAGANHVARQSLVVGAAYGVVMTPAGILFAEPILTLFGVEADVLTEGVAYLRVFSISWVPMSLWFTMLYGMQAAGDVVHPMRIEIGIRSVHVALCPFLVLGWWVFPRLGVSGAALANVVADSLGMLLGWWVLFGGRTRLRLTLRGFRLAPDIIWRIVKIGIPACVMSLQGAFGSLVLMWLMVPFGTVAVASHALVQRVHMVLFLPNFGLSMGAAVLVGQNLGAGQPGRAERNGWLAAGFAQCIMLAGAVVILLWAESIIGIFNTEPTLVKMASAFLRIAAVGYLVMGLSSVLGQSISGAGDTLPPMLIGLLTMWGVQLPLAFLLPRLTDLGVYGVRWAMVTSVVVGATAIITYFRLGRWKRKEV